jgi:hypothetical protein
LKRSKLSTILEALKFEGNISIRHDGFHGLQYIGGGKTEDLIKRFGGYLVVKSMIIDNVLVIYVN